MVYYVYDGNLPQEKLVYFLKDGTTFVLTALDISMKNPEELRYVLYLFVPKDDLCVKWRKKIQSSIDLQLIALNSKNTGYVPKYIGMEENEVEMKKSSAFIETSLGITHLTFTPDNERFKCIYLDERMLKSPIEDLRAAIYQTDKDDENSKKLRRKMIDLLLKEEDELMKKFLQRNTGFIKVSDFEKYLRQNPHIYPASI
ncbi:hypothetical protein POM88_009094 [Heracleum sosnowskyi]|uniref:Uncharacterized protein n=1 Tax=Heracleum sosnowskyi TaxID=360622 RepID=A0AAD8J8R1_9APIA|nr:hypothetical protein POM88_009094 [Heracleum sosnowskyi]